MRSGSFATLAVATLTIRRRMGKAFLTIGLMLALVPMLAWAEMGQSFVDPGHQAHLGRGPQGPITGITIPKSSWMAMTLAVTYDHPSLSDTLILDARWRRLNGRPLGFTPVAMRLAPGRRQVFLESSYHGMLPPPTPIVLHLELTGPDGQRVWQSDCRVSLVNPQGKEAWATDLMRKKSRELSWKVKDCT